MKFDTQLQPATETSWVVSYGGKTIPRWRTAAILKIDISPLSQWKIIGFSWNIVHISRFSTGWMSRYQKWKSCIGQTLEFDRTYFLFIYLFIYLLTYLLIYLLSTLTYLFNSVNAEQHTIDLFNMWAIGQSGFIFWATLCACEYHKSNADGGSEGAGLKLGLIKLDK